MPRLTTALVVVASVAIFYACALPSDDEYTSGSPDSGASSSSSSSGNTTPIVEAGAEASADATSDADAGNAALFSGGDFEGDACASQMYTFQSAAGTSADAHGGTTACQTCRAQESQVYYSIVTRPLVQPPIIGKTYRARVFVKRGKDSFKDQQVQVGVRVANNPGGNFEVVEERVSGFIDLTSDWQLLETSLTVTKAGTFLDTYVAGQTLATAGERCLIVDDLEVFSE